MTWNKIGDEAWEIFENTVILTFFMMGMLLGMSGIYKIPLSDKSFLIFVIVNLFFFYFIQVFRRITKKLYFKEA